MRRVIDSWNAHRIPGMVKTVTEKKNHKLSSVALYFIVTNFITGKGIPNQLARNGCLKKVPEGLLPHAPDAADLYAEELGNPSTRVSSFGADPLQSEEKLNVEHLFGQTYPDMSYMSYEILNLFKMH